MARMKRKLSPEERERAQQELDRRLAEGETSVGSAIREIRQQFLGLTLEEYAPLCQLSKNTLKKVELDDPGVYLDSVKKAIQPLGYRLTLTKKPEEN